MCDANRVQIYNMGHIFMYLKAISDLKINLQKSQLIAMGEVPHPEELANILSCSISSLPLKYLSLSLPLGASFKSKVIWDRVAEKMERILAS
jgi:hypothetical protein